MYNNEKLTKGANTIINEHLLNLTPTVDKSPIVLMRQIAIINDSLDFIVTNADTKYPRKYNTISNGVIAKELCNLGHDFHVSAEVLRILGNIGDNISAIQGSKISNSRVKKVQNNENVNYDLLEIGKDGPYEGKMEFVNK